MMACGGVSGLAVTASLRVCGRAVATAAGPKGRDEAQPLFGAIRAFGHTPGAMLMSRSGVSFAPCGVFRRCCSRRQCKTSTQTCVAFSRSWLAGAPPVFSPAESAARWLGLASVRPAAPWHRSGNRTASAGPSIIRATCLTQADILQCKSRWSSSQQHSRTSTHHERQQHGVCAEAVAWVVGCVGH